MSTATQKRFHSLYAFHVYNAHFQSNLKQNLIFTISFPILPSTIHHAYIAQVHFVLYVRNGGSSFIDILKRY